MGYYTGSGVVTGGGSAVSVHEQFIWFGAHNIYQLATSVVTVRNGVSLATAQSERGSCDMSPHRFTWGSNFKWSMNCKGTSRSVSYTQLGGSNLYALTVTDSTMQAKLDDQGWVS